MTGESRCPSSSRPAWPPRTTRRSAPRRRAAALLAGLLCLASLGPRSADAFAFAGDPIYALLLGGSSSDPEVNLAFVLLVGSSGFSLQQVFGPTGGVGTSGVAPVYVGGGQSGHPVLPPGVSGAAAAGGFVARVATANSATRNVSVLTIDLQTGQATPAPGSPFPVGGNAEGVAADPLGRFLYVTVNKVTPPVETFVRSFRIDAASGSLTPVGSQVPTGVAPVSVAVEPRGRFVYVAAGQNSGTVWAYAIDPATGGLTGVPGSPFAAGDGPATLAIDPTGRFLYVTNNFGSSISGFAIDGTTGALAPLPGSPYGTVFPSGLAIDPSGRFLYTTGNDTVRAFGIDRTTGTLAPVGSPRPTGRNPISVAVHPEGIAVYTADLLSDTLSGYAVDPGTGALTTALAGSPVAAVERPFELVTVGLGALPDAAVGTAYAQAPALPGFTPPFSFTLSAGALPPGLSLNASTGVISGTPTGGGVFQFRVQVTDAGGRFDTRTLGLRVAGGDTDGDGVPDGPDLCPGTPPGTGVGPSGCSSSQIGLVPIPPTNLGQPVTFTWTDVGAAAYAVVVESGPGIAGPLVLGLFPCCGTSFVVPTSVTPGDYRLSVTGGGITSQAATVTVRSPLVLGATRTSVAVGEPIRFTWTELGLGLAAPYTILVRPPGGASFGPLVVLPCCALDATVPPIAPGVYTLVVVGGGIASNQLGVTVTP